MKKKKFILFLILISNFIYSDDFKHLWSEYITTFKDGIDDRRRNIEVAVNILNGSILYPNIEFSFIEQVIDKIPEDEMGLAPIISVNKRVPGIGGGLCQVATTLYNAALLAGISIRERKGHSSPVSYVPPGLDATVSKEEGIDLKIQNPYNFPLKINAFVENYEVFVRIYGPYPKKRNIKIIVSKPIKSGQYIETITERIVNNDKGMIFYELISNDKYKIDF